ncbi:MAG: hypothetical protein ABRQ25_11925 [Clostridiaceae bacterium]
MKNKKYTTITTMLLVTICMIMSISTNAYASPGGTIAKAAINSPLGRIAAVAITILLLPVIIYMWVIEYIAVSKTTKALSKLGKMNDNFRWIILNERAHSIITHVYAAWKKTDIEQAKEWMTGWYWQNQKLTVLESWEEDGLKNICKLNKIRSVKPLYIDYRDKEKGDGEGSRIVLSVTVNLQDYLVNEKTEKIVEGDEKKKDLETVWTLVLADGQWKLSLIEESFRSLAYAKLENNIEAASEYIGSGFIYKGRV